MVGPTRPGSLVPVPEKSTLNEPLLPTPLYPPPLYPTPKFDVNYTGERKRRLCTADRIYATLKYAIGILIVIVFFAGAATVAALFFWPSGTVIPVPMCRKSATMKSFHTGYGEEQLFVWGGKVNSDLLSNDAWHYNMITHKWSPVPLFPAAPPARWKFGEALLNNKLYIFGGDLGYAYTNDLWTINPETGESTLVHPEDDNITAVPRSRRAHNLVPYNSANKLLVFGGRTQKPLHKDDPEDEGTVLNDLWAFDVATSKWQELDAANKPPKRKGASVNILEKSSHPWFNETWGLVMHGGRDNEKYFGDLWVYLGDSNVWVRLEDSELEEGSGGIHFAPLPRNHHMNVVLGNRLFVVFGRGGRNDEYFNDVWSYNLEIRDGRWTRHNSYDTNGRALWKRFLQSTEVTSDGKIIVFGGEGQPVGPAEDGKKVKDQKINDVLVFDPESDIWTTAHACDCSGTKKKKKKKGFRAS